MIPGNAVLDAFISANVLIAVAYVLWIITRHAMQRAGLKNAYTTQLKVLNGVFVAIVLSPFVMLGLHGLQNAGMAKAVNVNLTDMVVSHYLNGGFQMKASEFERLLLLRDTFTLNVLNAAGWVAWAAIGAFVLGGVIGVARLGYSVLCLHRIVGTSYEWRRFGRVRLHLSDRTLVPFSTRGIWNYYVVLPSHMLSEGDTIKVSLAHEFQHLRRGDIEWEILLEALKPFFFLNPAYHAWKRQVEDLRELSCDSEVLTRGRIQTRSYCETLLSACQATLRKDRDFVIAVPKVTLVTADRSALNNGKKSFLEQRITSLLEARRLRYPKLTYAVLVFPLIAATMLVALAIQRPADWSHDRLMLSTVVNLERLDEINRLSTFGRIRN